MPMPDSGFNDLMIEVYGFTVNVHHRVEGSEGEYGDPDVPWVTHEEKAMYDRARQSDLLALPEGEHQRNYRFYYFKADVASWIGEGDIVEHGDVKYEVLEVESYEEGDAVKQVACLVRRVKE